MKYHDMLQKRDTIARQMRELNDAAKTEKRAFSEEENSKWADMTRELDELDAQISREEQLRGLDEKLAGDNQDQQRQEPETDAEQRQAAAFDTFLRRGAAEMTNEERAELRALGGTTGSTGGFTVPAQFRNRVVETMKQFGGLANICQVLVTADGAPINWAQTDGTAEVGEMLAENAETGTGDPEFSSISLGAKKGSSKIILISNELLQDNGVNIDALLARRVASRLGRLEAAQIISGDGTGNNVKGLKNQISLKQQAAATAAHAYDDLIDLKHKVDPAYRGQAQYMFNDDTFKGLKKLKDGEGRPLWLPAVAGVAPSTIDGDGYTIDQGVDSAGLGKTSMYYGDFQSVILRRVQYMNLRRLTERYAEFDQMGFVGFHRFDLLLEDLAAVSGLTHS